MIAAMQPAAEDTEADGIDVVITTLEPTGSVTLVQARLGDQIITAQLRQRIAAQPGDTIRLGSAPENTHQFDARSERRIAAAG